MMNRWIRIEDYSIVRDKKDRFALFGIIAKYLDPSEYQFTATGVKMSIDDGDTIIDTILRECDSCKLRIVHN